MTVRRILILEDEALVALDLEGTVTELGWEVAASLSSVRQALTWLDSHAEPDAALLDVNLGGELVFPVAEALQTRSTPFAFCTGYADMVSHSPFADRPTLVKPHDPDRLKQVLDGLAAG